MLENALQDRYFDKKDELKSTMLNIEENTKVVHSARGCVLKKHHLNLFN